MVAILALRNLANYLAITQPEYGQYLVVEGWQDEHSLKQALTLFQDNQYELLITTGGPDTRHIVPKYKTYAEQSAAFLLKQGLDSKKLFVIATPASAQNRTFLSAVFVREWFESQNIDNASLDIVSNAVHARRTLTLYKMAFTSNTQIGIYASEPSGYSLSKWWETSDGAKSVLTEMAGIMWVTCCFNPGEAGSHQEKWGIYGHESHTEVINYAELRIREKETGL